MNTPPDAVICPYCEDYAYPSVWNLRKETETSMVYFVFFRCIACNLVHGREVTIDRIPQEEK